MTRHFKRYPLPTVETLTRIIFATWEQDHKHSSYDMPQDEEGAYVEVRLWTRGPHRSAHVDTYGIEFGPSQFDQLHGDYCSASSYAPTERPSLTESRKIAHELINELRDYIAQDDN